MAYNDDTATFVDAIVVIRNQLTRALDAKADVEVLADNLESLDPIEQNTEISNQATLLNDLRALKIRARAILLPLFSRIGRTIDTIAVSNGTVTDLQRFFRDWREYQLSIGTAGEYVNGRTVDFAADPADSVLGIFRRLLVDYNAQRIEGGRHNQTKTLSIRTKPSAGRVAGVIEGGVGPIDALDYLAGSGDSVNIEGIGDVQGGGLIDNETFRGNPATSDNAPITSINFWDITSTSTFLIETTAARLWRSLAYTFSVGGAATSLILAQDMGTTVINSRYRPVGMHFPVYKRTGWEGSVKVEWGSKSQTWVHGDLTADAWTNLVPDMDEDLYPINFDSAAPQWKITITTGAGAGANELIFAGFFAQKPVYHQQIPYFWALNDTDGDVNDFVEWVDQVLLFSTTGGEIQDMLGFVFDDETIGAYLNTDGSVLLDDPA